VSERTKLYRWIDLLAALLSRRFGCTLDELRAAVPGYRDGRAESVRRTFERDKDELRGLGVPIDTVDAGADSEVRYLLRGDRFYLPYLRIAGERGLRRPHRVDRYGYRALQECEFTDDELGLLADAAQRVTQCGDPALADDARRALRKLALDASTSDLAPTAAMTASAARHAATQAHLARLGAALLRRKQVTFTYYGMERDETERRSVLPYGLTYTSGHWYLHAHDPARQALRAFRVSRMRDVKVNTRQAGTKDFEIPAEFAVADRAAVKPTWALGDGPDEIVEVRFTASNGAVRAARVLGRAVRGVPDRAQYQVRRSDAFCRWILSLAGDAEPVAPPAVVRAYRELAERTLSACETQP
jgi:predicted DNA-binding transcriptional regulator YafY